MSVKDNDTVFLISQEGVEFKINVKAAKLSKTIGSLIKDAGTDAPIPLPNVTAPILEKVVTFLNYHSENQSMGNGDEAAAWNDAFLSNLDHVTLFTLILASNYLDIKSLLDLTTTKVARLIKGKTPEEVRKEFNITTVYTPEEEAQVIKENDWCEER